MLLSTIGYVRPASVAEAIAALKATDNARVLAGGQTMINVMKTRFASPEVVVDLAAVPSRRHPRETRRRRSAGGNGHI